MTSEQILAVTRMYESQLKKMASLTKGARADTSIALLSSGERMAHLVWMCEQMPEMLKHGDEQSIQKAMRWLGFIQGCLWSECLYSIDHLRDHNRPNNAIEIMEVPDDFIVVDQEVS